MTLILSAKFEFPPNYDEIVKRFGPGLDSSKPIFAYCPYVYNPHRVQIGPELVAHETVHCQRQGGSPGLWWQRYLADDNFRMAEEILAHVAEYEVLCQGRDRNARRQVMHYISNRLVAPMYGYTPRVPPDRGRQLLKMAMQKAEKQKRPATTVTKLPAVNYNA